MGPEPYRYVCQWGFAQSCTSAVAPLGKINLVLLPFDVAGWRKAPQPGAERGEKKRKKPQENLCIRLQLFASGTPAVLVAALGSGWCHFLPCRGIISGLNAYRGLPGVISLWVVSFAAHSICNITLGLFEGACVRVCARAHKSAPFRPCALVSEH